ncbi:MAG TPA: heavy metal translocating P-type ATPase [Burkholderiales bacterium]
MSIHRGLDTAHKAFAQTSDAATPTVKRQYKIGGMACSFCVASISKALGRLAGVQRVNVNLAHEEALVEFNPARVTSREIERTLRDLGYTLRDPDRLRAFEQEAAELEEARANLLLAGAHTLVSLGAMSLMWLEWMPPRGMAAMYWLMPILALSVMFGPGWHILEMAWASLRRGILNQHVLLEFGAFAGLIGGFLGYAFASFPLPDFFGVTVFVTTYHILSGYVSLLVRTRASQAVRKLLALVPPVAHVVRDDGREEDVPLAQVRVGDRVRVRPGESIPVDGAVIDGGSAVNESLVTGEAIPVEKQPGDDVIGGSINQVGTLLIRVTKVGEESFLSQVVRQVEEARALKPSILILVDRILQVYVPAVLSIAAAAFLFWSLGTWLLVGAPDWTRALFAALAVLVMGYPCALGMATPLAMIRGGGLAAERGILMRSAEAFQALKDVRTIVLDKTGTLTQGKPAVVRIVVLDGRGEDDLLRLAASIESASEHPLARAVVAEAAARGLTLLKADAFQSETGRGVRARIGGRLCLVGNPRFIETEGVDLSHAHTTVAALQATGNTVIGVAVDDTLAALIAIADPLKPDAEETIARLRAAGLQPVMLTGDHARTARTIAAKLGIDDYHADVLPGQKAETVRALQRDGTRVAMVGDGINDAPALMQADVGIAIGAGTDIAIEAADVVLIGTRLRGVVDAYHIGRASYRKTVQNLAAAFAFNGIGVPLAATGAVHPVWAMIAMAASVSTVLANSFGGRLLPRRHGPRAEATFNIANMHCKQCVTTIGDAVRALDGVERFSGDVPRRRVSVAYRTDRIDPATIRAAIQARDYEVE